MDLEESIEAVFGIFIVLALAGAFYQVLFSINPFLVVIFVIAVLIVIYRIIEEIS